MLFGMVSGVGQGMGVLNGVVIVEGEGAVLRLNLGRPIVTNGDFATRLFPNYSGQYLFIILYQPPVPSFRHITDRVSRKVRKSVLSVGSSVRLFVSTRKF